MEMENKVCKFLYAVHMYIEVFLDETEQPKSRGSFYENHFSGRYCCNKNHYLSISGEPNWSETCRFLSRWKYKLFNA